MKERRSSIELLRFLAAAIVVFAHTREMFFPELGQVQYVAVVVDFFFMLSGYFCMRDASAEEGNGSPAAHDAVLYAWRKAKGLYGLYFFALALMFVIRTALKDSFSFADTLAELFHFKWEFLMLHLAGFVHDPQFNVDYLLGPGWFVSALIITTIPVYFLARHFGKRYSGVIAPLCAAAIYCQIIQTYNTLDVGNQFVPGTMLGNVRAFAGLSAGAFVYHVNGWVASLPDDGKGKRFLKGTDVISWLMVLALFALPDNTIPEADSLFWMFAFAILLLNSMNDIGPVTRWLNRRGTAYWYMLGRMSLYVYLLHLQIVTVWLKVNPPVPYAVSKLLIFVLTLLFSFAVMSVRERKREIR